MKEEKKIIYFHLNTTNFIDPIVNGEKNNLGNIQCLFFNTVFSNLSSVKVYLNNRSEDPPFANDDILKGKKWLLCSLDDESVETSFEEILELMETAHLIKIIDIGKSLKDMGIHYDYITRIPNKEVDLAWKNYMAENNYQYIEEAVGNKNMTLSEKISFLSQELLNIGSKGNELTIFDPYLFPKKCDKDYIDLFLGIIREAEVSSLKLIIDSRKCDINLRENIIEKVPVQVSVYYSETIHDRWWIVENLKKGILCGTSLNGIGKDKLSTITPLSKDDVEKIINDISNNCILISKTKSKL
ncbi:hypothetical protein HMPREF1142_1214 [Peptostreptococcaceae bacterium AS15]|nr:hypothetical protein HMPREF1142_1214 [Peptostreptococcaceae bacterium AS15]